MEFYDFKEEYKQKRRLKNRLSSDPPGDRTLDPNIKSVVLYQLS